MEAQNLVPTHPGCEELCSWGRGGGYRIAMEMGVWGGEEQGTMVSGAQILKLPLR